MNDKKSNFLLISVLVVLGIYFLFQKNQNDIASEKKIVDFTEVLISKTFPSKEKLNLMNFSLYKNNEISHETTKILKTVKHLKTFKLQQMATSFRNPQTYTIDDEFQVGLENAKNLIKTSETFERVDTLNLIKKNLRLYKNAYYRLQYPADTSYSETFKKVFLDLASVYNKVAGRELERYMLYVMADCAQKVQDMDYYMVTPVLLTKIISDNPHDELARKSWILLNTYMQDSFTGSSGDNTPIAWKKLISDLAVLVAGN